MKFWVTVLMIFVCFNSAFGADSRTIEIDLAEQFNGPVLGSDRTVFLSSDNWLYGQTMDGLPVYRQTFNVPSGTAPRIVDISFAAVG